jgi:D-glycero-D-manno-heptose 1,7-bisphosphate phosphatase
VKRRAVFLDRDGVLNQSRVREGKPYPPRSVADVELVPGAEDALIALKAAGFVLIVVTNQPDVAKGVTSRETVEAINGHLGELLPIDRFLTCYHVDADACDCRKPLPGMLLRGAIEFDIALYSSYMVGDRWRDVDAGRTAGCKTVFLDYGYAEQQPTACDYRVFSMRDASIVILEDLRPRTVPPEELV